MLKVRAPQQLLLDSEVQYDQFKKVDKPLQQVEEEQEKLNQS